MRVSARTFAVGFGQNLSYFLAWSVIPVWARFEGGATPLQLGLLPVLSGVTYILVALRAGALSDRVPRGAMARLGMVLFAVFCVLAWGLHSVWFLVLAGILNGFAMALVWPALQAWIGDHSTARDLERNLGDFSLSWSAGKTVGFVVFAFAYKDWGLGIDTLLACGAASLLLAPLLPSGRRAERPPEAVLVDDDHHTPALRAAFLRAGWWGNFAAYGLGSTVVYLYPDLLGREGRPEEHQGYVLGGLYCAQTAGFWFFGRFAGWRYRLGPVLGWMAAGAAAMLVIGFGAPLPWALGAAAVLGLALGQAYAASVYYSVHSEERRGARAGIHEAVIGASDFTVPMLGGALAQGTGWTPAPYVLAGVVAVLALAMAARAVRGAPATSATA